MVLNWSCYGREGKTKSKLVGEGSHASRYRNCYKAVYPNASHNRRKEKVVCNVAVYKRRGLS